METDRLRKFCTVVETMNMRKAAELLGISHSGLSKSIKSLEEELSLKLISKSGRGIIITDEGFNLYKRSERFFNELDFLVGKSEPSKNETLRLGSFEVFTTYFLGELVKKKSFDCQIEVHELIPGHMEQALIDNKIDIALTCQPIPKAGLDYIYICKIKKSLYGNKQIKKKVKGYREVLKFPFAAPITPLKGLPGEAKGLDGWPEKDFPRNIKYQVEMMETALQICSAGKAIVYLPSFIVKLRNKQVKDEFKLVELPLSSSFKDSEKDVYLIKRDSTIKNESINKIIKAIQSISS